VTAEIVRGGLETNAYEMATHVSLTATTPILNQSNERNATILDASGGLAALSVGIPQFMLSSTLPVRFALEFFGRDGLYDGDVLIANDPYHGGGHLPDYNVFAPVVRDGELVLIASIQCHHAATGGGMPGGYNADAADIWAEGVRFPAVKLYERGVERRDVTYLMRVNNRTPTFLGDLRAQVGAAQLGVRRLEEVLSRHGTRTVRQAVQYMIDLAARRFRAEVAGWRDGVYESDVYVDHDPKGNPDIHLHCRVTIRGERLRIDFTGSDDRPEIQAYSSFGNTRGYVVAQLASMMDPAIPKNEGFFRAIELIVPKGCCLNPPEGRSVAAGTHHPGAEVGEAIAKALEGAVPERCCPQIYKIGMPTVIFGTDPRSGGLFIDNSADTIAAHCSAAYGQDGWGDERQLRQPHPRHRRDQREHLSPAPARPRLLDRQRRRRPLARRPRHAVREAAAGAGQRLHLRRRPQVSRARHRRRQAGGAQPARAQGGRRARGGRHDHAHRRARRRRGDRLPLRRRRRLGRSARARPAKGARRRARRVRLAA
jgi:N-methylhydantoinase B